MWGGGLQTTAKCKILVSSLYNQVLKLTFFSPRITKMPLLSHAEPLFIYQFTAKSKCSQVSNQTLQVLLTNANLQRGSNVTKGSQDAGFGSIP